jgi:hypothetical protein
VGKLQRWTGTGWTEVPVPFSWGPELGVVRGAPTGDVWVANGAATIARWDGSAWADLSPSVAAGSFVPDMRVITPSDIWIVNKSPAAGGTTASAVLHWNGASWTEVPLPPEAQSDDLETLWATASNDVWVGGYLAGIGVPQDGTLLHWDGTTLGVHSFGPFSGGRQFITQIWASSAGDVWVAGGDSLLGAKLSHFDGAAWTEIRLANETSAEVTSVWGSCATSVWAASQGGIWHDDGTGWVRVLDKLVSINELSGTGPDDVWASGQTVTPSGVAVFRRQPPSCGDELLAPGEECDPPRAASAAVPACDQTCKIPTCGNLIVDPLETCDPPNGTTCDGTCQQIPIVCGNGIVQPGETCEYPGTGALCVACVRTACGDCVYATLGAGQTCSALSGQDRVDCEGLLNCAAQRSGLCASTLCYCGSTVPCSLPQPCDSYVETVAHTTDPLEVQRQIADSTTVIGGIYRELRNMASSPCARRCAGF